MDFFWLVPLSLAVIIGVYAFYRKVMRDTGPKATRTSGTVLFHKPRRERKKPPVE